MEREQITEIDGGSIALLYTWHAPLTTLINQMHAVYLVVYLNCKNLLSIPLSVSACICIAANIYTYSCVTATIRKITQTCCWEKIGQDESNKKKQKGSLQWTRSCWKTGVSAHNQVCIHMRGCCCSGHSNSKLDWSLLLITWRGKKKLS